MKTVLWAVGTLVRSLQYVGPLPFVNGLHCVFKNPFNDKAAKLNPNNSICKRTPCKRP